MDNVYRITLNQRYSRYAQRARIVLHNNLQEVTNHEDLEFINW